MVEYKTLLQEQLNPFMPYLLKAEEIWLVGGAIRDAVLGVQVKDFDFALKDNASDFARQFANEINGTYVLLDAKNDESRVVYKNQIVFDFIHIETIENDLARRDFRINAMAMRLPCFELVDPYGGLKDIERKRIKMVSESALVADPLRILRGFRFKATLGFKIEVNTLKALAKYKELLPNVAPERIHYELFTLLDSPNSYKTLRQMTRYGVLQTIIPVIRLMEDVPQGKPGGNLLDHLLLTMKKVEEFYTNEYVVSLPVLKLGALLHDIGKPDCYSEEKDGTIHFYGHEEKGVELLDSIRKQVNLSNDEFKVLQSLLRYHMRPHLLAREKNLTNKAIWRLVRDGGEESPAIFLLAYADALASGGKGSKEVWELLKRGIEIWNEMRQPKFKPLLTGDDLIEIGFKPGPIFREILEQVEEARIEGELHTTEEALKFVKRFNLKRFNLKRFNLKENFYEN